MLNTIGMAAENFCTHQMGIPNVKKGKTPDTQMFITYIDININNQKNYRVYIMPNKDFIQNVAEIFLEEEQSDTETLQDMALETANLIVGSAKVIAQKNKHNVTIQTPHFEKIGTFDAFYDERETFFINTQKSLTLAIKELNV